MNSTRPLISASERQAFLRALGVVPMQWRERGRDNPENAPPLAGAVSPAPFARSLHLWFPPEVSDPFSGPQAALLKQVLKALDHEPSPHLLARPATGSDVVLVAFGPGAPDSAVTLPRVEKLRDPIEKRIAWKQVRTARKQLRGF